ncbi:MAG: beta-lactamase family protein [Proteobacteria bacterium]|nr:beta-lactamase family protein [Pseudomonadota bacterium]MBU1058303.1 beta-lactamase family protein [Pseudomonadota bacterium]
MDEKRGLLLDELFLTSLNDGVFPGAGFGFSQWKGREYERSLKHYGYSQLTPVKKKLKKTDCFDLASLTKPLATVPVLLSLFGKKSFQLTTTIEEIFSFCPPDKKKITIQNLMSHCSGLPAHREYYHTLLTFPERERKRALLCQILEEKLNSYPGTKHCYSDLGFILLGFIIEKISGEGLDVLADKTIYTPLRLHKDLFFAGMNKINGEGYVCTEKCPWSQKMLCGSVHDDNCRAIGGVAGHAGLFGTLQGVTLFCEQLLDQWQGRGQHPAYANTLLGKVLTRERGSTWTLGFDTPSKQGSSSGIFFSERSVGHLGFTGTSFWIDPEKECIAVLLTNRVHPSRENEMIRQFRPLFHDILMRGVTKKR